MTFNWLSVLEILKSIFKNMKPFNFPFLLNLQELLVCLFFFSNPPLHLLYNPSKIFPWNYLLLLFPVQIPFHYFIFLYYPLYITFRY